MGEQPKCIACGQALPPPDDCLNVTDKAILDGLILDDRAMLYAPALQGDTSRVDGRRWFLTGPKTRRGYLPGPFALEQVRRLERDGHISLIVRDRAGAPAGYCHRDHAQKWSAQR